MRDLNKYLFLSIIVGLVVAIIPILSILQMSSGFDHVLSSKMLIPLLIALAQNIVACLWVIYLAGRHKQSKLLWGGFALCLGFIGLAIYYLARLHLLVELSEVWKEKTPE